MKLVARTPKGQEIIARITKLLMWQDKSSRDSTMLPSAIVCLLPVFIRVSSSYGLDKYAF
jgi:hypothetical protein